MSSGALLDHVSPAASDGREHPRLQRHCRRQIERSRIVATVIRAFVPLNESAFPNLPVVTQLALPTAPTFPFPDASATLVPMPSLNE